MTQAATESKIAYIANALKMNFAPAAIARGLGMTESAVSQLISTYGIVAGGASKKAVELDQTFDDIEALTASKLKRALAVCDLDPVRLSMVLSRVNGLKRRSQGEGAPSTSGTAQLVNLTLPENLTSNVRVTLSATNQVIEIEGRTVATIDKNKLHTLKAGAVDALFAPSTRQGVAASDMLALQTDTMRDHIGAQSHDIISE